MMSPICKISKIQQTKEENSYKKTKQKKNQTHREQTHGNQWGSVRRQGQYGGKRVRGTNY